MSVSSEEGEESPPPEPESLDGQEQEEVGDGVIGDNIEEIYALLTKMKENITDPEIQWQGFDELCRFAYQNAASQALISEAGGLTLICRSMSEHLKTPEHGSIVQASGCLCLANMSFDFNVNDQLIAIEGGLGAILASMQAYPNDEQVQKCACMALRNLSYQCCENRVLIARAGGIPLIFKALETFLDSPEVQAEGCAALGNLAVNTENKNKIAQKGGVELCRLARMRFKDDENTRTVASGALWRLSFQQGDATTSAKAEENKKIPLMRHGPIWH